jgi:hypothetical protein
VTYTVAWGLNDTDPSGQNTITVSTVEDADAALDHLAALAAADGRPRMLHIYKGTWHQGDDTPRTSMQIVWGHPDRASLTWLADDDAGRAQDANLTPWPEPIGHDQDEIEPHHTRLTPATVREAVRQYVATGKRPTCTDWITA